MRLAPAAPALLAALAGSALLSCAGSTALGGHPNSRHTRHTRIGDTTGSGAHGSVGSRSGTGASGDSGARTDPPAATDWLVRRPTTPVTLTPASFAPGVTGVSLGNGLASRGFTLRPDWATVEMSSLAGDVGPEQVLRSIGPEAVVTIGGKPYPIGGLVADETSPRLPSTPFLNRSALAAGGGLRPNPGAFHYVNHTTTAPEAPFPWTPGTRGSPANEPWPRPGLHLAVAFGPPEGDAAVRGVVVTVHYEMYVGHPVIAKWVEVSSSSSSSLSGSLQGLHHRAPRSSRDGDGSIGESSSGGGSDKETHDGHVHHGHSQNHNHHANHADHTHYAQAGSGGAPTPAQCKGTGGCDGCPGTVTIQPCDLSDPKQRWALNGSSVTSQGLCLSSLGADLGGSGSAGCAHLAPCNASDPAQRWSWAGSGRNGSAPLVATAASSHGGPLCAAVTADRVDAGAWWNVIACSTPGIPTQPAGGFALLGSGHIVNDGSVFCASADGSGVTPSPPPPPPPPGPPGQLMLTQVVVETLAVNAPWSPLPSYAYPTYGSGAPRTYTGSGRLHVELEFEYGDRVEWSFDASPQPGAVQPVMRATFDPELADMPVPSPGEPPFVTFRVFELLLDDGPEQGYAHSVNASSENEGGCSLGPCVAGTGTQSEQGVVTERSGLARRKMIRLLAPQTQESPVFFHLTSSSPSFFANAITQMNATGFDMVIFSFGSGFHLESTDPAYIASVAKMVATAHEAGIEVGAYDLIGWTRNPGRGWMATTPSGSNGPGACWASGWRDWLGNQVETFMNATGLSMVETDGPFAGYACSNASHSHHHGVGDSVYQQVRGQAQFYRRLRERGAYVNAPDMYFFAGSNKQGIGYNEDQFNLPRAEQMVVTRATLFDKTFVTPPTAGWSFVPLVDYHGGGDAASFWPPSAKLKDYETALAMHFGAGVAACYRGPGLYDTPEAAAVVKKWVSWFRQHQAILTSDIIHLRRPDGQSIDGFLHANADLEEPALAVFFNPTLFNQTLTLQLPLYYAGFGPGDAALVSCEGAGAVRETVSGRSRVPLTVTLAPRDQTWFVVTRGASPA